MFATGLVPSRQDLAPSWLPGDFWRRRISKDRICLPG